jgi:hypothetical protein
VATFSSCLNVAADFINSRGGGGAAQKNSFFFKEMSPIYDTASPKQKRKEYF